MPIGAGALILPGIAMVYMAGRHIYNNIYDHWSYSSDKPHSDLSISKEVEMFKQTKLRSKLNHKNMAYRNAEKYLLLYIVLLTVAVYQFDEKVTRKEIKMLNTQLRKYLDTEKAGFLESIFNHIWEWDFSLKDIELIMREALPYEVRQKFAEYALALFCTESGTLESSEMYAFFDFCKNIGLDKNDVPKINNTEVEKGFAIFSDFADQDISSFSDSITNFMQDFSPETLDVLKSRITVNSKKTLEDYMDNIIQIVKEPLLQDQYKALISTREHFLEVLNNRMQKGEITYTRFKSIGDETYAQVLANLKTLLSISPLLNYSKVLEEENEGFQSDMSVVQNKDAQFKKLYLDNEHAINMLDDFNNNLSLLTSEDYESSEDMDNSMKELKFWAKTSKKYE